MRDLLQIGYTQTRMRNAERKEIDTIFLFQVVILQQHLLVGMKVLADLETVITEWLERL